MITKEELERLRNQGYNLTEIANIKEVDTSYISRLFKKYDLKAPSPGRQPGYQHSEETKQKISETIRRKQEGG